jgi:hypothetical protein
MSPKRRKSKRPEPQLQTKTPEPEQITPFLLILLRRLLGPVFVIGGLSLIPTSYLLGVTLVYVGFIIAFCELIWDPLVFRLNDRLQIALFCVVIFFCTIFTLQYLSVPIPPDFGVMDYGSGFVDDSGKVGDVPWKNDYHDVRISIGNNSNQDYTDISVWVSTDPNIAHVGRFDKCLDGSVGPAYHFGPTVVRGPDGTVIQSNAEGPTHIPFPGAPGYFASSFGSYSPIWKIHCDKIKRHDSIDFVIAVVHLEKKTYNLLPPQKPSWVEAYFEYESMGYRHKGLRIRKPVVALTDLPGLKK